ncbi:uncharacterized protein LOC131311464 isoform X2 [Rhododendron vialii]|uniref:uncharacterized protein LOC131311464 isoform X2 n=1 Tax=Rhododendron vialii TaxID=182163 RepID=UPI00265EF043|nr:uncharacterized protein LOC131311464 isoform X2 [Rhododendron vialii]
MVAKKREIVVRRGSSTQRQRASAGPKPRPSQAATRSGGARTLLTTSSASGSSTASVASALSGESVAENCQILQSRVNRFKGNKDEVDTTQLKGYSCDIKFTDKELDIIEMAVYGDVIRPGNQCRCRTVAEMLGKYKSKDSTAACKLPQSSESL